jgi:site-specific DNA-adenine methylase
MSETESWSLACGHCEKTLPEQTRQYVSPTCDVCRFHVHEECLDECLEKLAWPPDHAGDQGWGFACGHCGEALPPQVPGKESPTCANCHYHMHLRCLDDCREGPRFEELTCDYKVVSSSKQINTSEKASLDVLYPVDKFRANNGNYRKLLTGLGCTFVRDLGSLRLSCGDGLAWLNPYTGNQHNRCVFVQLALAALWRDSASAAYESHLFEAFLGSGQVFLNFNWCGKLLGTTTPSVVAGDLNVCLCAAWMGLAGQLCEPQQFLAGYLNRACRLDSLLARAAGNDAQKELYDSLNVRLNVLLASGGELSDELLESYTEDTLVEIGQLYVYLNNRCANQTSYNLSTGKFSASLDQKKCKRLGAIRTLEWNALCRVSRIASAVHLDFARADFAVTTTAAGLGDVVVYDCPFPEFSIAIPETLKGDLEVVANGRLDAWPRDVAQALTQCSGKGRMRGGKRYGANDGEGLQIRILQDAVLKQQAGASVVICNYATPTLLIWYSKLSYALYGAILPMFVFKRPQKGEELYFIAIWPSQSVLTKSGKGATAYLTERLNGVYRAISQKMSSRTSLSEQEVKLALSEGWKG